METLFILQRKSPSILHSRSQRSSRKTKEERFGGFFSLSFLTTSKVYNKNQCQKQWTRVEHWGDCKPQKIHCDRINWSMITQAIRQIWITWTDWHGLGVFLSFIINHLAVTSPHPRTLVVNAYTEISVEDTEPVSQKRWEGKFCLCTREMLSSAPWKQQSREPLTTNHQGSSPVCFPGGSSPGYRNLLLGWRSTRRLCPAHSDFWHGVQR